jgi:hypothetical protein
MIVAIDVDVMADCAEAEWYAKEVAGSLLLREQVVERLVVLTNPHNHARFETLRDERCDVAMVHRPLFEGRTVADWSSLLFRHPRTGAELLTGHLAAKLRIVRELGAGIVHFPADAAEAMDLDAPCVVSLHGDFASVDPACPLSATLAHAVILESEAAQEHLCGRSHVAWAKAFVAPPPATYRQLSTREAPEADNDEDRDLADLRAARESFAAAICEAYEHAIASFELRSAA